MSIPNIIDKIKGNSSIDKTTIMYLFVVVGVGVSAFGLGRLSMDSGNSTNEDVQILNTNDSSSKVALYDVNNSYKDNPSLNKDTITNSTASYSTEKKYVASKNGKLYYSVGCAGAKRIAEKNKIWFANSSVAEKSGYTPSPSCK